MVQSEYSLQNCNQMIDFYLSADPKPWEPSQLQDKYQVVSLILICHIVFENDKIGTISQRYTSNLSIHGPTAWGKQGQGLIGINDDTGPPFVQSASTSRQLALYWHYAIFPYQFCVGSMSWSTSGAIVDISRELDTSHSKVVVTIFVCSTMIKFRTNLGGMNCRITI